MKPTKLIKLRQPVTEEMRDSILALLKAKFYNGEDRAAEYASFMKDRKWLLYWVVMWPSAWLYKRGVTIHGDAYCQIFNRVFIQAAAHVTSKVKYRPAYLRQVIQSYFKIHGEEVYEEAKMMARQVENLLQQLGQPRTSVLDPVAELARARSLIAPPKRAKKAEKPVPPTQKPAVQPPVKDQLSLF